ncbi:ribonuclease H-like domain-containing protein [Tanacetum coccineum]
MHDPREPHLNAMKRVLRYLRGTTDLGLQLFRSTTSQLIAYSDADWAGCSATRRSTSGYCVFLGDNLLSWSSKRQDTLSRSSAEAEYRGVANAVAETSWIRNLLRELHTPLFYSNLGLLVDGYRALVERYLEVEVTGLDREGKPIKVEARGWQAHILQHECDHLEGTLYVDKMVKRTFRTIDNVDLPLAKGCPKQGVR